jgi:hypothetical protein
MTGDNVIDFLITNAPPGHHQDSQDMEHANKKLGKEGSEICFLSWDDAELSINMISNQFHLEVFQSVLSERNEGFFKFKRKLEVFGLIDGHPGGGQRPPGTAPLPHRTW